MNGTPGWVTVAVAIVTAATALSGTALATWRQNRRAGREEWFRRLQWAEQLASDPDGDRRAFGRAALRALVVSRLATREDLEFIASHTDLDNLRVFESTLSGERMDDMEIVEDTGTDPDGEETP